MVKTAYSFQFTTLKSLLKELRYFLMYSDGFIPKSLANCTRKYRMSLMPTPKAASFTLQSVLSSNTAARRKRINRIKAFTECPEMDFTFL